MVLFVTFADDFPEDRVDGGPLEDVAGLETDLDRLAFDVVGLELKLIDEVFLVLQQKTIST